MKVASTDHKKANNLTSWIICFLSNENIVSFVFIKTKIAFDLVLFRKLTFFFISLIPGTLYISRCLANIYSFIFDCVIYIYTYEKYLCLEKYLEGLVSIFNPIVTLRLLYPSAVALQGFWLQAEIHLLQLYVYVNITQRHTVFCYFPNRFR